MPDYEEEERMTFFAPEPVDPNDMSKGYKVPPDEEVASIGNTLFTPELADPNDMSKGYKTPELLVDIGDAEIEPDYAVEIGDAEIVEEPEKDKALVEAMRKYSKAVK